MSIKLRKTFHAQQNQLAKLKQKRVRICGFCWFSASVRCSPVHFDVCSKILRQKRKKLTRTKLQMAGRLGCDFIGCCPVIVCCVCPEIDVAHSAYSASLEMHCNPL